MRNWDCLNTSPPFLARFQHFFEIAGPLLRAWVTAPSILGPYRSWTWLLATQVGWENSNLPNNLITPGDHCERVLPVVSPAENNDGSDPTSCPKHLILCCPAKRLSVLESSPSRWYKRLANNNVENKCLMETVLISTHSECPRAPNHCDAFLL